MIPIYPITWVIQYTHLPNQVGDPINRNTNKKSTVNCQTEPCVMKTNLMHYLSSVYFVNQTPHVSSMFVAHHQEVYCIYTTTGKCCAFQLTVRWPGWVPSQPGQHTVNWKTQHIPNVSIHTVYLLMMGYKHAQNMWRLIDEINWV